MEKYFVNKLVILSILNKIDHLIKFIKHLRSYLFVGQLEIFLLKMLQKIIL